MAVNYTLQDIFGILAALPAFIPVLLAPGYLLGQSLNLLDFRIRGFSERLVLSVAFSCAVSPYLINLLCRFFAVRTVSILFSALGLAFFSILLAEWRRFGWRLSARLHWTTKASLGLCLLWLAICLASLPDLQLGETLYSTSATYDHAVRNAFIASALRSGAPPANPFFYPGHSVGARYYYYWYVLCAIPASVWNLSPRIILYASCFWSGLCLASAIPLYLKYFLKREANLRLTTLLCFTLLAITGLDLIPCLLILLFPGNKPYADMEWWDPVQITSWLDSLLWVPHHVASLVACLIGFLLLWTAVATHRIAYRICLAAISAIAFSSAAGLSVYVALTFALFASVWIAYLLLRGKFSAAILHAGAGLLAVLLSGGYLIDLLGHNSAKGSRGSSLLGFALRPLPEFLAPFPDVLGRSSELLRVILHFHFYALTLFLELGVYFAVGVFAIQQDWKRRDRLEESQKCLWIMVFVTFAVITLLRSTVIGSNDLACRGSLVLQFVLLLWTAIYLTDRVTQSGDRPWKLKFALSKGFRALILIGALSSLYQLFFLRTFSIFDDRWNWEEQIGMASGLEAFSIRDSYRQLDRIASTGDIVQYNPESKEDLQYLVYSRYQQVDASSPGCGVAFGGSLEQCYPLDVQLKRIYDPDSGAGPAQGDLFALCRSMRIDWLMVDSRDPIWLKPDSWVWHIEPAIQNNFVRVYTCDAGL